MLALRAPPAILAACLLAAAGGCASQRCRVTSWFEVDHRRRVEVAAGLGFGENVAAVRVRAEGGWAEVERHRLASYHLTRDGVLVLIQDAAGNAQEAQVFVPESARPRTLATTACPRPLVLAAQAALLCWTCTTPAEAEPFPGCAAAAFAELGLDGTDHWERTLPVPVTRDGQACRIEELHGLSAGGHPVVRLGCPARESARWIDPWFHTDVELRADGMSEVEAQDLPHPVTSLAWTDRRCPRWVPGP